MRLVVQVAGGILLAGLVVLIIVGIGSIKVYPVAPDVLLTPTALPPMTASERDIYTLAIHVCGTTTQDIQTQLDKDYAALPPPAPAKAPAEQQMLTQLMRTVAGAHPHMACEFLAVGDFTDVAP